MLGLLIPTLIMRGEFRRNRIDPEISGTIAVAAMIGGLIRARLYYIIERWPEFLQDPKSFIFTGAGLVWYGGFIGGFLAVAWVIRHSTLSFWKTADLIAPLLLLGQAFGRMGCFLSGDGDYGPPADVPWAMAFPRGVVPTEVPVHPTPLYDIILLMTFFLILWKMRRRPFVPGTMLGLYLIAVGVERFITEFWRTTPKIAFGWMSLAQIISLAMLIAGLVIIEARKRATGK